MYLTFHLQFPNIKLVTVCSAWTAGSDPQTIDLQVFTFKDFHPP